MTTWVYIVWFFQYLHRFLKFYLIFYSNEKHKPFLPTHEPRQKDTTQFCLVGHPKTL